MAQKICAGQRTAGESATTARLEWTGKEEARSEAEAEPTGRLERDSSASVKGSCPNLVIEGDNLPVLKLLATEFSGSVGLIYIDPPYNTGNTFQYVDRYPRDRWLNMMYPRLWAARTLLRPDGLICISIDDNEMARLRLIMDEIFGEHNFLSVVTVRSNPRGRQAEKHFAGVHEYLLVYARNADQCTLNGMELTAEQLQEFNKTDENGRRYRLLGLRQRGAASRREDRPALHYPLYVEPATRQVSLEQTEKFSEEALPKKSTGAAGRWMWCRDTVQENIRRVEGKFIAKRGEWDIFIRDYLHDHSGVQRMRKVSTIWDGPEFNYQNGKRELRQLLGEAPVDYPKPTALIQRAINLLDDPNMLVLDFFAGTGTTGQAVLQANAADGGKRSFILVQQAEAIDHQQFRHIAEITGERMRRYIGSSSSDSGFQYLRWRP